MKKHLSFLLLILLAVLAATTFASNTPTALTRQHDPVVLTGDLLPDLLNSATDEIFVYAFTGGTPAQIPYQVDEQNADGMFVPNGNGLLDGTEELVFMASDAGDYEPDPLLSTPGGDIYPDYVVTLSDPLSSEQAWAYIYSSPDLAQTFAGDYVSYNAGNDRIASPGLYSAGFNATQNFRDYLTMGAGPDILDRDKIRLDGYVVSPIFPFSLTEDDVNKDAVHAIDGPVRVTRVVTSTITVGTTDFTGIGPTFFYRDLIVQPVSLTTPPSPVNLLYLRNSSDLNASASGMTYYDANNPAGFTINGTPDTLVITPVAEWQQVGGTDGTFITVLDAPDTLPGTSTYYKDDSTFDPGDTGDQVSYGDAGFQVDDPPEDVQFDLLLHMYFLSGSQPNVGATYFSYYSNPLNAQVDPFGVPTPTPTEPPTPMPTATPTPQPDFRINLPLVVKQ